MLTENEAIARRWIEEVWNQGKEETIDELFSETGTAICPFNSRDKPLIGIKELKDFFWRIGREFSDFKITVEEVATDSEKVVALCNLSAKRRDTEADGTIIWTTINVTGIYQVKIRDGKVYDAWNNFDLRRKE